jgi:hypothetical protein
MEQPNLIVSPTREPRRVRTPAGEILTPPPDWDLLPPGDAGLTRRVKAAGPSWTVLEKRGRKQFSHGVWAPAANIRAAREQLEAERASPAHARKRQADALRRERTQENYVEEFAAAIRDFLAFAPAHAELAERLTEAVTRHATPVGSGTVARTKRIPVARRAEAAVIAWLRHQTTGYDHMPVARVRGERRRVRQRLARTSHALLDAHRTDSPHDAGTCPLCRALPPEPGQRMNDAS